MSRIEKQLQKILGESVETETPQSRIEDLIQQIIDSGGGGGGGGSAEPFFFVSEVKGIDPQSGEPIIEETSTTYNDVISKINSGCPIYGRTIVPVEYASMTMGLVDGIESLMRVSHFYDSESNTPHIYQVAFGGQITFSATSPTAVLSMGESGGGGGGGGDTPVV